MARSAPIDDSAAPIRDAGGNVVGSVLVFRDISERKRSEDALHDAWEWLRVTLASIGDAVITTDEAGRVTFLNGVAQDLTGWPLESAKGQPLERVFAILNEQTRQTVENPVERVLREGVVVGLANHTILIARDGTERPIDDSAAPIRDATAGATVGVVLTFRDVTEQRRAEIAMRESEARKTAILETALDCIITCDHEGLILEFNPAAEKTFGYCREKVIGRAAGRSSSGRRHCRHAIGWDMGSLSCHGRRTGPRQATRTPGPACGRDRVSRRVGDHPHLDGRPTDVHGLLAGHQRAKTNGAAPQPAACRDTGVERSSRGGGWSQGRPAGRVRKPRLGRGVLLEGQRAKRPPRMPSKLA